MTFIYKALNPSQEMVKGEVQASSPAEALKKIHSLALLPLDIKERVRDRTLKKLELFKSKKVKKEELMVATRELSVMLKAGIPILRALRILIDSNKDRKLGEVLDRVYDHTKNGESLAAAMEKEKPHFADTIINMVRTGEKSGELPQVLRNVSKDLEHALLVSSEVRNALAYPSFLLVMSGVALMFIFTFVIPKFTAILDKINVELPFYSRIVLDSGTFVQKHFAIIMILLILLGFGLYRLMKREKARYLLSRSLLRVPLVRNLFVQIELSRFSHALAILLSSGVEIINSIRMSVEAMSNVFLQRKFSEVTSLLKRGESLNKALRDVNLFPTIAVNMIEVGEETGKLSEILEEISILYIDKFRSSMKRMISLLEPAIITVVGVVIGFIVISLVSAIMSMNEIRF
jgi:type II secretory pathway component PulF